MIKVTSLMNTDMEKNTYKISAFADTKSEVGTSSIEGLPKDATIEMGSSIMTAAGELAFMKSDGNWSWV